ncbi:hypothetical protein [Homoserinibacter sp. GY 40078]|uniref:hypothetical protein n=1 Tax=Homoserinibacter sp. GY 40078 TaxID=2603275 RepID=UPI0011CAFA38|nr:hypothetical protein [Homoserinibacter sp. GY 40078]TXK19094.1 hypothetical protein FVQ89_04005 [Homoserinibacter sp. GY 40078]
MSDVGYGEEPTQDDLDWAEYGKTFTPATQIELLNATSEKLVGRTALVGIVLAAGGLVAVSSVLANSLSRGWAIAAVTMAGGAILVALVTQVRWPRKVRPGDIHDLKRWHADYVGWRRTALAFASFLLVPAFLAAAVAAGVALTAPPAPPAVNVTATTVPGADGGAPTQTLTGSVTIPAQGSDDVAEITVVANGETVVRMRQAASAGTIAASFEAKGVQTDVGITVTATSAAWKCVLNLARPRGEVCRALAAE